MSKKLAAEAWTWMRYSSSLGVGSGSSVTLRSAGPYASVKSVSKPITKDAAEVEMPHLDVFFDLDSTHDEICYRSSSRS